MSTEITIKKQELTPEVLAAKAAFWSKYGSDLAVKLEQQKQTALDISQELKVVPSSVEQLPAAMETLTKCKKYRKLLTDNRIEATKDVTKFLQENWMAPEKALDPLISIFELKVLELSRDRERRMQEVEAKKQQAANFKRSLLTELANRDATYRLHINDKVQEAYFNALNTEGVTMDSKEDYLDSIIENHASEEAFKATYKIKISVTPLLSAEERKEIMDGVEDSVIKLDTYITHFKSEVISKFSDFDLALQNKAHAIAMAIKEKEEEKAKIKEEQAAATVSAQFMGNTTSIGMNELEIAVKALKKSYVVDLPVTLDSIPFITTCFISNWAKMKVLMANVKSPDSFTIGQMKNYIAKLKNDDYAFEFSGIKWKIEDKLK